MGQLHDRMAQDLVLRNLSPATRRNYLLYCRKFAAFYRRSPAELGEAEVRTFLLDCIQVQRLSYAAYRQIYAALKFLYTVTLKRPWHVKPRGQQLGQTDQALALRLYAHRQSGVAVCLCGAAKELRVRRGTLGAPRAGPAVRNSLHDTVMRSCSRRSATSCSS